jgi:hypothetical protein
LPVPPNSLHLPQVSNPGLICGGASFSAGFGKQGV